MANAYAVLLKKWCHVTLLQDRGARCPLAESVFGRFVLCLPPNGASRLDGNLDDFTKAFVNCFSNTVWAMRKELLKDDHCRGHSRIMAATRVCRLVLVHGVASVPSLQFRTID